MLVERTKENGLRGVGDGAAEDIGHQQHALDLEDLNLCMVGSIGGRIFWVGQRARHRSASGGSDAP